MKSLKSSLVAFMMPVVFGVVGQFILGYVFHIHLFFLRIAGGFVLLATGYGAVSKGIFLNQELRSPLSDDGMPVIPLAAPMIAGPGTITAAITMAGSEGFWLFAGPLAAAILVNYLCMLGSRGISAVLGAVAMTGPLIRITGLFVMAIAVELVLNGVTAWLGAGGKH